MTTESKTSAAQCPYTGSKLNKEGTYNTDWWPNHLDLTVLRSHTTASDPMDKDFDYAAEFKKLNIKSVQKDIEKLMTTSQEWWPADYGHYGPFFIRMAWHSAGTYRTYDGRGGAGAGMQRFAPLNSWPDNVNLDKARRLLWPIKQKYGKSLSWADLMILAGNCALESMGLKTFGFGGGRADVWEPDETYWGKEQEWLTNERYSGDRELENPLAAVQMGLIYVNPEGPDGNPDFQLSANDIRETFARMAMNDEETVALIAGGHAFGKAHGAGDAAQVGEAPEGAELHQVGLGWANSQGKGHSEDTISSGLEGAWTPTPIKWDNTYLELIFKYEWEKTHSPAGAVMWHPIDCERVDMTPDAHIPRQMNLPVMFTTDLALRYDSEYEKISRKFLADFDYFADQFARAWFKLTHRDMGPRARYHGDDVPAEVLLWQDPVAEGNTGWTKSKDEIAAAIIATGLSNADLVKAAWRSASTFRNSDKRGGANGARIALEPQRSWAVNADVMPTIEKLAEVKKNLKVDISLADLIVFAGNLAIERAALEAGIKVQVELSSGRGDSTQDQTDVESFKYLKPTADGFINWSEGTEETAEHLLLEKASLLGLTPPELTVLVGGLRAIGATSSNTQLGVLTSTPGVLNNEFFRNLLDNKIAWALKSGQKGVYGSHAYADGERKWTATRADLVFASNSVLRAVAEVYAADDANEKFVKDFVSAWTKVMKADLF